MLLTGRRLPSHPSFSSTVFLVLEDHLGMRQTIRNMLRKLGAKQIHVGSNGQEGLRLLSEVPIINFAIVDWNMPVMDGLDFLKAVRAGAGEDPMLPVLFVTGEMTQHQVTLAAEYEASGYIVKPFVLQVLAERLIEIWFRREKNNLTNNLVLQGRRLLEAKDIDGAKNAFEEALRRQPDNVPAIYGIGKVLEATGNDLEALEQYRKAASQAPMFIRALKDMARLHSRLGNKDAAIACLERVTEISPNNHENHMELARAYRNTNRTDEAEQAFRRAISRQPRNKEATLELSNLLMEQQRYQEAVTAVEKAQKYIPRDVDLQNNLGIALRRQGKFEEALEKYKLALKKSPDNPVLWYNRAIVHFEAQDLQSCALSLRRALELAPDLSEAERLLSYVERIITRKSRR